MVSDGSQKNDSMSFGWILGITNGPTLAEHSGPAYGHPSSHRAEGWGMLSGARFLFHLLRYCHVTTPIQSAIETISDNAGLITRMKSRTEYTTVYPNATLEPDWDLTEQIHSTHLSIDFTKHKYAWEKGHQDAATPKHNLSATALFNVRADQLAEEYMSAYPLERLRTPLLPSARCQLEISGCTIDGHYKARIRTNATEPEYFQYLQEKHTWDKSIISDINWVAFRAATRNSASSPTHLLKLIHGKLPTRKHKSRFQAHVPPTCHYCDSEETLQHLVRCDNPLSKKFRAQIISDIRAYGSKHQLPACPIPGVTIENTKTMNNCETID
jgi:hypothetical protein